MIENPSFRKKLEALYSALSYRPASAIAILVLSTLTAFLEGIGLSFIIPVIEQVRADSGGETGTLIEIFTSAYGFLGIPFTLETTLIGAAVVMTVRYTTGFAVSWMKIRYRVQFVKHLRERCFERLIDAEVSYFDRRGADEILNATITQSKNAGQSIRTFFTIYNRLLLSLVYLGIAMYMSWRLTIFAALLLGGLTVIVRVAIEPGYAVGDRVATMNENVQEAVQTGTEGIRDVKLFTLKDEIRGQFYDVLDEWSQSRVRLGRNQKGINNGYQMATALSLILLIYVSIRFVNLSLAGLGVFIFAMLRLAPKISNLNNLVYKLDGMLPHLIRTQEFVDELETVAKPQRGEKPVPDRFETFRFDDVQFSYDGSETVLDSFTLSFDGGEFVAFVGSSGAGKSTVVSLLTRLYDPDGGQITVNGTSISEFDLREWRDQIAVVRQDPYIFNDTLYYNLTIGNRDVSRQEVERVCEIAQVTEFLDELENGFETVLGDDGVRLSGGQRQRVAVARALLKDAQVLILDEATSDMDTTLENRVHSAIETMDEDYTMIVIAHRLSTVKNADKIYTLEAGQLAEVGDHDELLRRDGQYAELYANQTEAR